MVLKTGNFAGRNAPPQGIQSCEGRRGDECHRGTCNPGRISPYTPGESKVDHDQRRVAHRQRTGGDEQTGAVEIERRGNVIPRFVPEIRQAKQRQVQNQQPEESRKNRQNYFEVGMHEGGNVTVDAQIGSGIFRYHHPVGPAAGSTGK